MTSIEKFQEKPAMHPQAHEHTTDCGQQPCCRGNHSLNQVQTVGESIVRMQLPTKHNFDKAVVSAMTPCPNGQLKPIFPPSQIPRPNIRQDPSKKTTPQMNQSHLQRPSFGAIVHSTVPVAGNSSCIIAGPFKVPKKLCNTSSGAKSLDSTWNGRLKHPAGTAFRAMSR